MNLPLASAPLSQLDAQPARDCARSGAVGVASPVAIGHNLRTGQSLMEIA
ncbi:hypothetical protein [Altericista sp. CCNU0014]